MHALTHNNHFRFGYDDAWFNRRQSRADRWHVAYGPCERTPGTWREECLATAQRIRDNTDLPIWLLFSGGIDSEVAAHSFRLSGIPFKVAIIRFEGGLNLHDISYAMAFCDRYDVPHSFLDLDIVEFFGGPAFEYAALTHCVTPQFLVPMWAADQLDGYPIIGGGECLLVKRVPEGYVHGVDPYEASEWEL